MLNNCFTMGVRMPSALHYLNARFRFCFFGVAMIVVCGINCRLLNAHDLWIELNHPVTRLREPAVFSFKLGNCDSGRADFKVSGTLPREAIEAVVVGNDDVKKPIVEELYQTHSSPEQGFWQSRIEATQSGTHWVVQRLDQIVEHDGKKRGVLFAKAPWIVSESMDQLDDVDALTKPTGFSQPFEIIVMSSVLPSIESHKPILIQLLRNGEPMAHQFVEFGMQHMASEKEAYRTETDAHGIAEYMPGAAGICLISSRFVDDESSGPGYDATYYSTSVCLHITQRDLVGNIVAFMEPKNKTIFVYKHLPEK